jgi:hypothetical protein
MEQTPTPTNRHQRTSKAFWRGYRAIADGYTRTGVSKIEREWRDAYTGRGGAHTRIAWINSPFNLLSSSIYKAKIIVVTRLQTVFQRNHTEFPVSYTTFTFVDTHDSILFFRHCFQSLLNTYGVVICMIRFFASAQVVRSLHFFIPFAIVFIHSAIVFIPSAIVLVTQS